MRKTKSFRSIEMFAMNTANTLYFLNIKKGWASFYIGSITSRCSGKEPALLPRMHGLMREDSFVSPSQSGNRPHIFVGHKSMHKLSRQIVVNKNGGGCGVNSFGTRENSSFRLKV